MFRCASNNTFISVDTSKITQVFCSSRYRLSIHGLCLSVILYSCMEQLITEAAALNLAHLSALKCLQHWRLHSACCLVHLTTRLIGWWRTRKTITSSSLTVIRLHVYPYVVYMVYIAIVYPYVVYMVYIALLYYMHTGLTNYRNCCTNLAQ